MTTQTITGALALFIGLISFALSLVYAICAVHLPAGITARRALAAAAGLLAALGALCWILGISLLRSGT